MKPMAFIVFFLCSSAEILEGQPVAGPIPGDSAAIRVIADQAAMHYMRKSSHVGLSIGILCAGKRYTFDYGVAEIGHGAATSHTIYELASVTKSFTGILLAHAVIEKKLRLQDDIRVYLPGAYPNLAYRGHPVTIVDLANHTAGFSKFILPLKPEATPDQKNEVYAGFSRDKFLLALEDVRPDTVPGTRYAYSNMDVELLGIILENVYHVSYGELVNRYILRPNHMDDTHLVVPYADRRRAVAGYDGNRQPMPEAMLFRPLPAAGGLVSTTADMLNYLRLNLDEKDVAIRLAHAVTFYHTDERGDAIGLCWFIHPSADGSRLVRCAGGSFGCTSYCVVDPARQLGIVCLANDAGPGTETELVGLAGAIMTQLK